jgi:hypothetical protein
VKGAQIYHSSLYGILNILNHMNGVHWQQVTVGYPCVRERVKMECSMDFLY